MTFTHQESRGFIGSVIILCVSAVLAVCFDYLVIDKPLGIGFPLFISMPWVLNPVTSVRL